MALVSAADLLGTSRLAAVKAADIMGHYRETSGAPYNAYNLGDTIGVEQLRVAEEALVQALAELRAARWGVERRMPQFDDLDLQIVLNHEEAALREARDLIPR